MMELPIVACDFNFNGNLFVYAVSYDWSKVSVKLLYMSISTEIFYWCFGLSVLPAHQKQ